MKMFLLVLHSLATGLNGFLSSHHAANKFFIQSFLMPNVHHVNSYANNIQESYDLGVRNLLKQFNLIHFLKSHVGCYCEEIRLMMGPHRNLKREH